MPERSTWRWPFSRRLVATVSRKVVVAVPATALHGHPTSRALPLKDVEIGQLVPRGVRGVVARALVDLLVSFRDLHAVEFTALAMATVYGPRQRADGGVVGAFVHAAANATAPVIDGDGRQTRDLLYVDDAVDALARAGERGGGLLVNVGTGVQTSVGDLWDRIARLVPGASDLQALHGPAAPTNSPGSPSRRHEPASTWHGRRGPTSTTAWPACSKGDPASGESAE